MAEHSGIRGFAVALAAALVGASAIGRARESTAGTSRERSVEDDNATKDGKRDRGRSSDSPWKMPLSGWRDVLLRVYSEISKDNVLLVAAGIAFYGLLALFPAITALVSIYGFFADPTTVAKQLDFLSAFLPQGALGIIGDQMQRIATQPTNRLSIAFFFGLVVAIWSANSGIKSIFEGLNVAYEESEERSFLRLTAVSLLFTLGALLTIIVGLVAIVAIPIVLNFIGLGSVTDALVRTARWPVLLALIIAGISVLYRYGPSRSPAQWRWVSPGSLVAAFGWIIVSGLFSWYVAHFGSYNQTYGSLGAVIAFMVWMWLSASVILLGAELNAELEHQTIRDTTTHPERKMGDRGATMADTVAASPSDTG